MILVSLLLLAGLLPYLALSASVNVGIVNGTEAKPHSRPYMVSVQKDGEHICGGFLVSERFVITAAHCRTLGSKLTVVMGAHLLGKTHGSERREVEPYVYENYNDVTFDSDLMLLKLRRKATKSPTVSWISLPKSEEDITAGSICSVAGWGYTGDNKPISNALRETNVSIVSTAICNSMWREFQITPRMICAFHPGGFCQGDSGGPLVCNNIAVGIVSFNEMGNCNSPRVPNVYTKISAFLPWIKRFIG